jgi:hypothetical protein
VESGESGAAVKIVGVDHRQRLITHGTPGRQDGEGGPIGLSARRGGLGDMSDGGPAGPTAVEVSDDRLFDPGPIHHDDSAETGGQSVVDGVIHERLTVGPDRRKLLHISEALSQTRRQHYERNSVHHPSSLTRTEAAEGR